MAETQHHNKSTADCVVVLKASIHCQGCKRKVQRILSHLHGVHSVDVDTKQQKVTVTGTNLHPDTLIAKLVNSGKSARLWQSPQPNTTTTTTTTTTNRSHHEENPKRSPPLPKPDSPHPQKTDAEDGSKPGKVDSGGTAEDKVNSSDAPPSAKTGGDVEESKKEEEVKKEKKAEDCSAAGETPDTAAEKSEGGGGKKAANGSGRSGKKKKNKGQSEGRHSELPGPPTPAANEGPPPHHDYTPPQPMYGVSYNTAYPSGYTTSYYAPPPPYAYMQPPPSDVGRNPRQPLDSFEMFSDENPNGCYVM